MSRVAFHSFEPGNVALPGAGAPGRAALWFVFRGGDLLVKLAPDSFELPAGDAPALAADRARHYLGVADGSACWAVEVGKDQEAAAGWSFEGLRSLFSRLEDSFFLVAARALEVLEWDRTHRYCGTCGTPTVAKEGERARECPACSSLAFPRISPAVIMAVTRGEKLLLARARRFPPGFFSVLAGFVEPGETLEQCVAREVKEETGIDVRDIRYVASQPWPFPHSLMIAFTAEYAGGEIAVDPAEIVEAAWYAPDALPQLPDRLTVARRLINGWLERHGGAGRSS